MKGELSPAAFSDSSRIVGLLIYEAVEVFPKVCRRRDDYSVLSAAARLFRGERVRPETRNVAPVRPFASLDKGGSCQGVGRRSNGGHSALVGK